jgi:Galactoside-binding lectin
MVLYHLFANKTVQLTSPFRAESIAIIRSTKLAFAPSQNATGINFVSAAGNILLHISIRPGSNAVVFNSKLKDGAWGPEEHITFNGRFKDPNPSITVYDHGDRFQVLFDFATVIYYKKRISEDATTVAYNVDAAKGLGFSDPLTVEVVGSLGDLI